MGKRATTRLQCYETQSPINLSPLGAGEEEGHAMRWQRRVEDQGGLITNLTRSEVSLSPRAFCDTHSWDRKLSQHPRTRFAVTQQPTLSRSLGFLRLRTFVNMYLYQCNNRLFSGHTTSTTTSSDTSGYSVATLNIQQPSTS